MTETKSFEEVLNSNGAFLYKNVGVSMLPLIRQDRDFIYIRKRPDERLKKYDVVLFHRPNAPKRSSYVLHRILKVNPDGTYWIIGDNCISGETVKEENIIGILTAVKRKGKTVGVSDFGYRIYVYLWCAPWRLRVFILRCKSLFIRIARKALRVLRRK